MSLAGKENLSDLTLVHLEQKSFREKKYTLFLFSPPRVAISRDSDRLSSNVTPAGSGKGPLV